MNREQNRVIVVVVVVIVIVKRLLLLNLTFFTSLASPQVQHYGWLWLIDVIKISSNLARFKAHIFPLYIICPRNLYNVWMKRSHSFHMSVSKYCLASLPLLIPCSFFYYFFLFNDSFGLTCNIKRLFFNFLFFSLLYDV